jgi:transcriptional regulator
MYVPQAFRVTDRTALLSHAASYPFATVITRLTRDASALDGAAPEAPDTPYTPDAPEDELVVSHLPLLVDLERGWIRGHVARENPQLRHLAAGAEVLAVFHGPHGYVSPSVYLDPGVPTWNYVAVHARGRARVVDEAGLRRILDETVARFDSSDWTVESIGELLAGKLAAIAGFEMEIDHLEGKWKLSQNRSATDRARVVDWLERGDDASRATAAMMRELASRGG